MGAKFLRTLSRSTALIIVAVAFVTFPACAFDDHGKNVDTKQTQNEPPPNIEINDPPPQRPFPPWVDTGSYPEEYPLEKFITGSGSATGHRDDKLVERARSDARTSVSKYIKDHIKSEFYDYQREVIKDDKITYTEDVYSRCFEKTEAVLHGCGFREKHWDEANSTLYILAVMNRKEAANNLAAELAGEADEIEAELGRGQAALGRGEVPEALSGFRETRDRIARLWERTPSLNDRLFTLYFLVNNHPAEKKIREKRNDIEDRIKTGMETVAGTIEFTVSQQGKYLPADESEPVRIEVKAELVLDDAAGSERQKTPARGVPLMLKASGGDYGITITPESGRTDTNGILSVVVEHENRSKLLSLDLTVLPDRERFENDGLPPEHAARIRKTNSKVTFLPFQTETVLVAAAVEVTGAKAAEIRVKALEEKVLKLLLDGLAASCIDAESAAGEHEGLESGDLFGIPADRLKKQFNLKGRLLCVAKVCIRIPEKGFMHPQAVWQGLDIIDLREGTLIASGLLKGEEKGAFGGDADNGSMNALDTLIKSIKGSVWSKLDEYCSKEEK